MALPDYSSIEGLAETVAEDLSVPDDVANELAGILDAEASHEYGDADELYQSLKRGASGLIVDGALDLVSGVDVPAIDSQWTMMKSADDDHSHQVTAQWVLAKDDGETAEKRIAYAPAMIPREADKEGDVVPTPTVEEMAHGFLKEDGGIDTDHNLIDGKGEPVESWLLREDTTFELPSGTEKEYPAGTWMLGVQWESEPWERIKSGELDGLSIYGTAEQIELSRSANTDITHKETLEMLDKQPEDDPCWDGYEMVGFKTDEFGNEVPNCVPEDDVENAVERQFEVPFADETVVHLVYESRTAAEKASEEMGLEGRVHEHEFDGMAVFMPGANHEEFVDAYMDMAEDGETTEASTQGQTPKSAGDESDSMAQADTEETAGETPEADPPDEPEKEADEETPDAEESAETETETVEAEDGEGEQETETVAIEREAATLTVSVDKAGKEEIVEVMDAMTDDEINRGMIEEMYDEMKADDGDGEMSDEEMMETEDGEVDPTGDIRETDEEDKDGAEESAGEDSEDVEKSDDGDDEILWKGSRMPEDVRTATINQGDESSGGDPTRSRADVLEDE